MQARPCCAGLPNPPRMAARQAARRKRAARPARDGAAAQISSTNHRKPRPRMKPEPLLSRADSPCGFLFCAGEHRLFVCRRPSGTPCGCESRGPPPKKGKRSEPGQSAPAPRPLSIPRFFLSPSAPPESKPRGAHAGHGGQQPRAGQCRRACHAGHGRSLCAFHRVDNGKTGRLVPLDAQADQRAARHKSVPVPIGNAFHDLPHRIGAGPSGRVMALEVLKDALQPLCSPRSRTRPSIFSSPSVPR